MPENLQLDQDKVSSLVAFATLMGLRISANTEAGAVPLNYPTDPFENSGEIAHEPLLLMGTAKIWDIARKQGYTNGLIERGMIALRNIGRYYPDTADGVIKSREFMGRLPLYYYGDSQVTPRLRQIVEQHHQDLTEGITTDTYRGLGVFGPEVLEFVKLEHGAELDVRSLRSFMYGDSVNGYKGFGRLLRPSGHSRYLAMTS